MREFIYSTFKKSDLFGYVGSYEDFDEGTDRYYAQLAVDRYGSAVRDNSLIELVDIGLGLDDVAKS